MPLSKIQNQLCTYLVLQMPLQRSMGHQCSCSQGEQSALCIQIYLDVNCMFMLRTQVHACINLAVMEKAWVSRKIAENEIKQETKMVSSNSQNLLLNKRGQGYIAAPAGGGYPLAICAHRGISGHCQRTPWAHSCIAWKKVNVKAAYSMLPPITATRPSCPNSSS